jgi:hypothetical protein
MTAVQEIKNAKGTSVSSVLRDVGSSRVTFDESLLVAKAGLGLRRAQLTD